MALTPPNTRPGPRRRGRRWAAGAAGVLVLVLAGCQDAGTGARGGSLGASVVSGDDAVLGGARVAMYLSPQYKSLAEGHDEGFVVLADEDGGTRAVRTSGMDTARLVWTGAGLFFADGEHDYRLGPSGLRTTPSEKPNGQVSLHAVGNAVVGLYNEGFSEDGGYREHVVEHRDGRSASRPVDGAYWTVARCDDEIYGWTRAMGPALDEYPAGAGTPLLLTRLWPGPAEVVATATVADDAPDDTAPDAPCADGVVHVLTSVPDGGSDGGSAAGDTPAAGDGVRTVLRSWDTRSGERTDRELVDDAGTPLALTVDDMLFAQYGAASVTGGDLRWLGADGVVRATELATGTTRELFRVDDGGAAESRALFTRDALFVLTIPGSRTSDLTLTRHPFGDGTPEEVLRIPGVAAGLDVDMVLRGIALSPDLVAP